MLKLEVESFKRLYTHIYMYMVRNLRTHFFDIPAQKCIA